MTDQTTAAGQDTAPDGQKLFYRQPELLNHEAHGSLGLRMPERPFEFARKSRALPLTLSEIASAQKHFPIVFSDLDNPVPLAVVGTLDDVNLFIDEQGQWERETYIPAYVRCYPFALAARSSRSHQRQSQTAVFRRRQESDAGDPGTDRLLRAL